VAQLESELEHPARILVADDDSDLRGLIAFTLSQAGYDVQTAQDGATALASFERERPDLLLLDINMPPPNGLEVCRTIRSHSLLPIMMLTVRDHEDDLIAAFECGVDDYLSKPFSPRVLLARVRALLRRAEPLSPGTVVVGDVTLDLEQHVLAVPDRPPLHITPLEVKALHLLIMTSGRTVTPERLLNHIWGRSGERERRTLKQLIYRLRLKLEADPAKPQWLQTTPGAGYRFVAERTRQ
jgi:DNA-binding response OmpR family regulator